MIKIISCHTNLITYFSAISFHYSDIILLKKRSVLLESPIILHQYYQNGKPLTRGLSS